MQNSGCLLTYVISKVRVKKFLLSCSEKNAVDRVKTYGQGELKIKRRSKVARAQDYQDAFRVMI